MCDHHHAARHILCRQCDLLVALPQLEHRQKAACPRCGTTLTTSWDAPRQRPTAYALVALFMLLLANLFPFIYMKVGGLAAKLNCWKSRTSSSPRTMPASVRSFAFRPAGAGFLSGHYTPAGQPGAHAIRAESVSGAYPVSS